MTKFNQDMYAKLKARKNEPLSSIGQKQPRVTKEVVEKTVSTPFASNPKATSPTVSIEGITPHPKKAHGSDKGKSKVDSSIWNDAATALRRAHNVITPDKLKGLTAVPSHELVNHHIHKLVQVSFSPNLFLLESSLFLKVGLKTILISFMFY